MTTMRVSSLLPVVCLAALLRFGTCGGTLVAADPDPAISKLIGEFAQAWNSRGSEAVSELFTEEATQVDVWGRESIGRSSIRSAYEKTFNDDDGKSRLEITEQAISVVDTQAVVSGRMSWKDKRNVVLYNGHFMAVLSPGPSRYLFSDLRYAVSWTRPQGQVASSSEVDESGTRNRQQFNPTPFSEELLGIWNVQQVPFDMATAFLDSAHLVDADGNVVVGGSKIIHALSKRTGSCRVVDPRARQRGNLVVIDGRLMADGMKLQGLPFVRYSAVYLRELDGGRFVSQMNRASFAHLMNREFWAPTIESFIELDEKVSPPKRGLVFVGDSDVVGCDLDRWFPDSGALNRGFGGSHMDHVVHYLQDVLIKHRPSRVVLSCGGNDIVANKTPQRVHRDFVRFLDEVLNRLPSCHIFITAQHTPPQFLEQENVDKNIRRFNDLVRATASKDDRVTYMAGTRDSLHNESDEPDPALFGSDRVHFSEEGYRRWTAAIQQQLSAH